MFASQLAGVAHESAAIHDDTDALRILNAQDDIYLYAIYTAITRHLRRGGQDMLSYEQIASITPGGKRGTIKKKIHTLVDLGLLERYGNGNSAYLWRLPRPKLVTFPQSHRETCESQRWLPQDTNMMIDDDIHIDVDEDKSVTEKANDLLDQTRMTPQREALLAFRATLPADADHDVIEPLVDLANQLDIKVVRKKIALTTANKPINPIGYLTRCLKEALKAKQRPQRSAPPPKKYVLVEQEAPTTPGEPTDDEPQLSPATPQPEAPQSVPDDIPDDLRELWAAARHQLALQFDRASYKTFVEPVRVRRDPDGLLVLQHPTEQGAGMLQSRLYRHVQRILSDYTRDDVTYRVEVQA